MKPRLALVALLGLVSCVAADQDVDYGGLRFTIVASRGARSGVWTAEDWVIHFDRLVLGFRTMTFGKVGQDNRCSFRGLGQTSDTVFDPRYGIVQTFAGIRPEDCPDVGIFLAPPGDTTSVGPGVTSRDLVDLVTGAPAHAIVEATAESEHASLRIALRFDTDRTSSRFGGCTAGKSAGVRVAANVRPSFTVTFSPERLFFDALSLTATASILPFVLADARGDEDGIATMDELDAILLAEVRAFAPTYQLLNDPVGGSFGDYVRTLFRFTFSYGATGACAGNEPGSEQP